MATISEVSIVPHVGYSSVDYLTDYLGSVVGVTNEKGNASSIRRFKPSGSLLSGTALIPFTFGWAGNTGSRYTGLINAEQYNRARHPSSRTLQWTTRDPLWPEELPYGYVNGNPVTWIDPTGQFSVYLNPDCGPIRKYEIDAALTWICGNFREKLRACLCEIPSRNPAGTVAEALDALCDGTGAPIGIGCPDEWNGWCRKFSSPCGVAPGHHIVLCPRAFEDKSCGPVWCTLLHELLHVWGHVSHTGPGWECLSLIPSCRGKNHKE